MASAAPAPALYPTWGAYSAAVDAALAAGRRPPLWDPDLRWPDQLEAGTTVIRPGGGVPGDERGYLNVVAVSPDPDDPDAVLIADLSVPPVRVYLCDPGGSPHARGRGLPPVPAHRRRGPLRERRAATSSAVLNLQPARRPAARTTRTTHKEISDEGKRIDVVPGLRT